MYKYGYELTTLALSNYLFIPLNFIFCGFMATYRIITNRLGSSYYYSFSHTFNSWISYNYIKPHNSEEKITLFIWCLYCDVAKMFLRDIINLSCSYDVFVKKIFFTFFLMFSLLFTSLLCYYGSAYHVSCLLL